MKAITDWVLQDSELHPEIASKVHKDLTVYPISKPPKFLQNDNQALFAIFGPLKVIYQFCALWVVLGHETKPARSLLLQVSTRGALLDEYNR